MQATKSEQKKKAIEYLKKMMIYTPYTDAFRKEGKVCFFEDHIGFWAYQEEEIIDKIKEIEERYGCLVYAVTHEKTSIGELYDFLLVTDRKNEWISLVRSKDNIHYAFAYVWNKTDDLCSEFGTIAVRSAFGGIKRVG